MQLRDYQISAVNDAIAHLPANPCIVAPTGSGKTVMGVELVRQLGRPTLWLAHRRELIGQAASRLESSGTPTGVIMAGEAWLAKRPVQVASVQTLSRRRKLPHAEVIVIDEAHHTPGQTFLGLLAEYPKAARVGLTATPFRLDGRPLGDIFGHIVVAAHAEQLVAAGTLIEPRVYAPPAPSLRGVHIRAGDFAIGEVAAVVDKPKITGDVVATWMKHGRGRRTVLFAVNVAHSRHLIAAFKAAGVAAEHIDGQTPKPERAAALERLASGRTLVLSNCVVLTEGWDLPALEVAIVARPTASLCLHLQMIGRIMRACPGKTGAIVLDHAGNFHRHGRVTQRLEYSLTGTVQRAAESAGTGLRTCRQCFRMVLATRATCPECGADLRTQIELPTHEDGELEELTVPELRAATRPDERAAFWHQLKTEARDSGRKPGWVAYRFKERFGIWPHSVTYRGVEIYVDPGCADPAIRSAMFEKFTQEGRERGYKHGYAYARFRELFGEDPGRRATA